MNQTPQKCFVELSDPPVSKSKKFKHNEIDNLLLSKIYLIT